MKLIYIYHSGYAILTDSVTIIIDYYKDSDTDSKGVVHNELLKRKGDIYVLSTHSHHDHFNPEIIEWRKNNPNIIYVLSKEIQDSLKLDISGINYLDKLDIYKDNTLSIKAFGSTDIGGSLLIELDGKKIFHAGDLNNWHWNEESTSEEIKEAEDYYSNELNLLAKDVTHLDLAMFPIDPRLGKDFMKGAEQFVSKIKTDILAPMHFAEAYAEIAKFEKYAESKACKYISWTQPNQSINF